VESELSWITMQYLPNFSSVSKDPPPPQFLTPWDFIYHQHLTISAGNCNHDSPHLKDICPLPCDSVFIINALK